MSKSERNVREGSATGWSAGEAVPIAESVELRADAMLLADGDTLQVFTPTGVQKVRAARIEYLHQKMVPYLDGSYRFDDLIAAVPPTHVPLVRSYLMTLAKAGALRTSDDAPASLPGQLVRVGLHEYVVPGAPSAAGGAETDAGHVEAVVLFGAGEPDVSRQGAHGVVEETRIVFVSVSEAAAVLSRISSAPDSDPRMCVVVLDGIQRATDLCGDDVAYWMRIARALVSTCRMLPASGLAVYRGDVDSRELRCLVRAPSKDASTDFGIHHLELTHLSERPQIPIASVVVGPPYVDPIERFALCLDDARENARDALVARTVLPTLPPNGVRLVDQSRHGVLQQADDTVRFWANVPDMPGARPLSAGRDLLSWGHAANRGVITYLDRVLSLRGEEPDLRYLKTPDHLHVVWAGEAAFFAHSYDKALIEALLFRVARTYFGPEVHPRSVRYGYETFGAIRGLGADAKPVRRREPDASSSCIQRTAESADGLAHGDGAATSGEAAIPVPSATPGRPISTPTSAPDESEPHDVPPGGDAAVPRPFAIRDTLAMPDAEASRATLWVEACTRWGRTVHVGRLLLPRRARCTGASLRAAYRSPDSSHAPPLSL